MEKQNKAKSITMRVILIVYLVASAAFIVYTYWNSFKLQYSERAYNSGRADTVQEIINQAENQNCQAFSVYNASKTVQLVNVACLQKPADTNNASENTEETNTNQ